MKKVKKMAKSAKYLHTTEEILEKLGTGKTVLMVTPDDSGYGYIKQWDDVYVVRSGEWDSGEKDNVLTERMLTNTIRELRVYGFKFAIVKGVDLLIHENGLH